MNIFTVPYGSKSFYTRPDTSLNKDSNDYFCPDGITQLAAAVFVYARAAKAGKSVASKFAPRYYNVIGTGIHLSAPELIEDGNPASWWLANSLDNSTFLLSDEKNAEEADVQIIEKINAAFEAASKFVSFRTGDYIAVEIQAPVNIENTCKSFNWGEKSINIIW